MATEIQRKINILELNTNFGYAGAQRTMLNFCKYLDKEIFNIFIGSYGKDGARKEAFLKLNVPCITADYNIEKLLKFIEENRIDIVHFHRSGGFNEFEYQIIKEIKNKNILIIETNVFGKFDKKSYDLIDCHLIKSKMMLNERFVKEVGDLDFSKMKVVYNPIDINAFQENLILENEIKKYKYRLGIRETDFVIGKMGRPHIAKWSDLLIDMMPYLIKTIPNIKLIIQAIPESRKKIILKSKYKDNYIFLDETSDDLEVALFYSVLDVYVHASKIGESFGMTLAEAGIFRKPVIVNSTPDKDNNQIELVDHMKTGIIANYPQTFARAIEYLYKNPGKRIEFGENGYNKIKSFYDAEKITRQLEKVFIEKISEKGLSIDSRIVEIYKNISYNPGEQEIIDFKKEYQKRLKWEFGKLTVMEKIIIFLNKPKKFYWKIRDFLEDKQMVRINYGK